MNIQTALLSIQALLTAAEPDDPQDWEVAEMYKQDRQKYENKAREWVRLYAQEGMITDKEEMVGVLGSCNHVDPEGMEARYGCRLCPQRILLYLV